MLFIYSFIYVVFICFSFLFYINIFYSNIILLALCKFYPSSSSECFYMHLGFFTNYISSHILKNIFAFLFSVHNTISLSRLVHDLLYT